MANIDLITGFLGAGKTTFIRKYTKYLDSIGESYVVIENEYGSKGIDSKILEADGIVTKELFGGCLCCTLKLGFHDMLYALADKVDRIIAEPSGIYDISQFFDVMNSDKLKGRCNIGNIICIVDPTKLNLHDQLSQNILKRQANVAGATVFSMDDDVKYLPKLISIAGSEINNLRYNDFDALHKCGYKNKNFDAELTHSAAYLSTLIKPAPCKDIRARIEKLFSLSDNGEILRVKGIWNGHLVNAIKGHIEIYKCDGEEGLNVIGSGFSRKRITEVLNNELN